MAKLFPKQDVRARRELIINGNPVRVLLLLSLPTIMMALVQSLIPLTDGLFLNNEAGYVVAAAVGFCNPIINILNALSQGIATAAMAMIGQMNGRGDLDGVRRLSVQIVVFGFLTGITMMPVSLLTAFIVSRTQEPELGRNILIYMSLYTLVLPFLFMSAIYNAIKNGTGQPESTFYRMIVLLALKVSFNTLYLTVLKLGIVGAALASLSAYILVVVWMYVDLFIRHGEMRLSLKPFHFDRESIRQLLKLGIPTMLSSMMINLGFFLINTEVASYGTVVLNAQTISSNINAMAFTLPSSIGTTVTTMVSINIAARSEKKARRAFFSGVIVSSVIALLLIGLFRIFSPALVRLFLNNPGQSEALQQQIYSIAVPALNIYTLSIVGFGIFSVVQGAFIGLAKTKIPLLAGFLRIWLFRYVFILAFRHLLGVYAVFWGNVFSNYMAALIFFIILMKSNWYKNVIYQDESDGIEQRQQARRQDGAAPQKEEDA